MCGHFGFATVDTFFSNKRKTMFEQGIYADALRGFDSTGIAVVDGKFLEQEPTIVKKALPAADFLFTRAATRVMKDAGDYSAMIGHNRWATKGRIIDSAAHPYQHGPITLAHNGTLNAYTGLEGKFETDSEEIPWTMALKGEKETLERIRGAFALVWYNSETQRINFARNDQRTFSYAVTADDKTIYWASEGDMLRWLLNRNDVKFKSIMNLNPGFNVSFDLKAKTISEAMETEKFKVYEYTSVYGGGNTGKKRGSGVTKAGASTSSGSPSTTKVMAEGIAKKLGTSLGEHIAFIVSSKGIKAQRVFEAGREHLNTYQIQAPALAQYVVDGVTMTPQVHLFNVSHKMVESMKEMYQKGKVMKQFIAYAEIRNVVHMVHGDPNSNNGKNIKVICDPDTIWDAGEYKAYKEGDLTWVTPFMPDAMGYGNGAGDDDADQLTLPPPDEPETQMYVGPDNTLIDLDEIEDLINDGCYHCGTPLLPEDTEKGVFVWDKLVFQDTGEKLDIPVCYNCVELDMRNSKKSH